MSPTSTTSGGTCDSTPWSRVRAGMRTPRCGIVALAGGETLTARYLITATGFLSQPHTPSIPGIESFAGTVIHTGRLGRFLQRRGPPNRVIGTGATAVQLIPELAEHAADLTVFQRTRSGSCRRSISGSRRAPNGCSNEFPLTQRAIRAVTDAIYEFMIYVGIVHHRYFRRLNIAAGDLAKMYRFATIRDKELRDKLTPDYDFGCKRPTFSTSYYQTFTKPNVHLETDGIDRIETDGVVDRKGVKTSIDTLVLATGYDLWESNFWPSRSSAVRAAISESGGAQPDSRRIRASPCRTSRT